MKVIKEVARETIEREFGDHRDAKYFVMTPFEHYYLVALTAEEFKNLLTNSSPTVAYPELHEFPTLAESVRQFIDRPELLEQTAEWRELSGTTVAEYLREFQRGKQLELCFVQEKPESMPQPGSYFICEGMHRLVAYGLYRELNLEDYEVSLYLMTNTKTDG